MPASVNADAIGLSQAYEAAVKKTETIPIQDELEKQAAERVKQAKGALFPNINFIGDYLRQDTTTSSSSNGVFTRPDQTTLRFNATQPLFQGFRDITAWKSIRARDEAQREITDQARADLYSSVAAAYYVAIAAEIEVTSLTDLVELTRKQEVDLSQRIRIGRSRRGELLQTQTQLATTVAQLEAAKVTLDQARDQLAFLTGLPRSTPLKRETTRLKLDAFPSLDTFVSRIENRPGIAALRKQVEASEEDVKTAWGGHLPALSGFGNYYLKRTGVLQGSDWDVGLSLTVPIFQGGITQSRVREASSRNTQAELTLQRARRDAEREIRSLYSEVQGDLLQLKALDQGLVTAEQNYRTQVKDQSLGLVTNLDVLAALSALEQTRRVHDRTEAQFRSALVRLDAATGVYPNVASATAAE